MESLNNYNQLNQHLHLNKIDISQTLINYNSIVGGDSSVNRYNEFKHGLGNDLSNIFKSLTNVVIFFFLLLTLGMLYFLVFSNYFHHTPEFKVISGIPLVLVTIGLFFVKSIGNAIITIWTFLFKLVFYLLILGICGGMSYVILHHLFVN